MPPLMDSFYYEGGEGRGDWNRRALEADEKVWRGSSYAVTAQASIGRPRRPYSARPPHHHADPWFRGPHGRPDDGADAAEAYLPMSARDVATSKHTYADPHRYDHARTDAHRHRARDIAPRWPWPNVEDGSYISTVRPASVPSARPVARSRPSSRPAMRPQVSTPRHGPRHEQRHMPSQAVRVRTECSDHQGNIMFFVHEPKPRDWNTRAFASSWVG